MEVSPVEDAPDVFYENKVSDDSSFRENENQEDYTATNL